ncbi:short-chain dehydrogenase [Halenospora varia]|nr:short-chain dehydrogenase [Halenospora varia]
MAKYNVDTTGMQVVEDLGAHAKDKILVITGPSERSLGAEAATTIAFAKPKHIILAGRSEAKIKPVIKAVKAIDSDIEVSFISIDLCDNASVRKAADEIKKLVQHVDILINCAGVMAKKKYETSKDGVEVQFAANHLGHFLLTKLLLDKIVEAKGTIVNVTSSAYFIAEVNTEDANFEEGKTYSPWVAYGRSKTANILFSYSLGIALKEKEVTALAADPGMVLGTQLLANNGVDEELFAAGHEIFKERNGIEPPELPRVTHQQGVATILLAALDPCMKEPAPCFLKECNPFPVMPYASDMEIAGKLWALSEKLVGTKFDI